VSPVFSGFNRKMEREVGSASDRVGRDAGSRIGQRMAEGVSQGTSRIRADLNNSDRDFSKFSQSVAKGSAHAGASFARSFTVVTAGLAAITPAAGAAGAGMVAAAGNTLVFAASLSKLAGVAALVPAGLMSVGAGAGTLVAAFAGVGDAMKTAIEATDAATSTAVANPRLAAMAVEDAMMAIRDAEENAAEVREAAARRVADAQRNLADAEADAAEAREAAARRVEDAQRSLRDAVESAAEAQVAAVRSVERAERDEAKAARDVIEAQKDLVKAREDAARTVNRVGTALEDANRKAVETATAYQDAVALYNAAASDPRSSKIRLTELDNNLARTLAADEAAKKSVVELRDEHTRAQSAATASNEKVLSAEQKLTDARQQQADAIQNRKDAQADMVKTERRGAEQVADAQRAVADATKAAAKSQADSARAIADAQQGIADATRDSERSQVDAAKAIAQAHRNLERTQMQQADTAAKAGSKAVDAMNKLTPSAQEAVRALLQVKEQLSGIRRIAQENFFTGFAAPLLSLSRTVMPQLAAGVGAIALALGGGAQMFMGSVERALGGGVLESLLLGVAKTTAVLNKGIDPVVQSFTTLGVVGMKYMPMLAQFITDVADGFNSFIQTAAADGSLDRWIEEGIQGFKDLWSIASSVYGIFDALERAAAAAGIVSTLGGMAEALRNVEAVMQGPVFQTTMATIFQGAEKGAAGLLAALGPIGDAFVRGAPAMAEFLRLGGEIAGTFLGGVFTALSDPAFGAGLVTFMQGLQTGVEATAPHLPGMAEAFGNLLTSLAPIAAVIGPALVQVLTFAADALANVINFLSPLLTLIAGSPVAMGILIGVFAAATIAAGLFTAAMAIQRVIVIGAWVAMGVQSMIQGARMAAAWLLAMGPIGWVIAAVVGLAAIIIANWDTISTWTKDMWEQHVKPVFDNLSRFITEDVPKAFEQGVKWIGEAWAKLQDLAKAPVKFVVDTVINKGLIDGLNGIGNFLNLPDIPHVELPQGFSGGGYTGPGGKYQPAGIVHAGEIVWSQDDIARWGGVGVVEAMRKAAGYALGGLVRPIKNSTISQPFHGGHNGIDFAAPVGTEVDAAGPGRVSMAGWSTGGGGNEIHIDHPNGLQTWYAHLSRFAVQAGAMVRGGEKIGEVGSTGNSTGPHLHYMVLNGGWPNYTNPAPYLDGGGEAGSGGWNPIAGIVDGLVNSFKSAFPAAGFIADLAIGAGKQLLDGAVDFVTGRGGKDKGIGSTGLPYLHDQGGVLPPGLSQVVNRTRKPEAILNPQQWSDIHRLATRGADTGRAGVNFNGPIHVRDENELARIIQTRQMDAMAVYR